MNASKAVYNLLEYISGGNMLAFFDTRAAIDFAEQLAKDFDTVYKSEKMYTKPDAERHFAPRYAIIVQKTEGFAKANKMNFYKKGKLLTHLKFRLLELGHEDAQASRAVSMLLRHV